MKCLKCSNLKFCKYADFFLSQNYIELEIKSCKFLSKIDNKTSCGVNNVNQNIYQGQVRPDINKYKNIKKEKQKIIKCPSCNGNTYEEDVTKCNICGATICPACSTNYNKQNLCDKCWSNI